MDLRTDGENARFARLSPAGRARNDDKATPAASSARLLQDLLDRQGRGQSGADASGGQPLPAAEVLPP
jgi:hypothetical protein